MIANNHEMVVIAIPCPSLISFFSIHSIIQSFSSFLCFQFNDDVHQRMREIEQLFMCYVHSLVILACLLARSFIQYNSHLFHSLSAYISRRENLYFFLSKTDKVELQLLLLLLFCALLFVFFYFFLLLFFLFFNSRRFIPNNNNNNNKKI